MEGFWRRHGFVVAMLAATATFLVDICAPLGLAAGVPYVAAIAIASADRRRWCVYVIVAASLFLNFAGFLLWPPEGPFATSLAVRGFAVLLIIAAAAFEIRTANHQFELRKALRQERDLLFEHSLDMLLIGGLDGYIRQVNPAFVKMMEYGEDELYETPYMQHVHPDDRDQTAEAIRRVAEGSTVPSFRHRIVTRSGAERWIEWSSPSALPGGEVFFAVGRDITEQLAHEEELRRAEAFLRGAIDSLSSHVCILDEDGDIVMVNQAWCDFADANEARHPRNYVGVNYLDVCDQAGALAAANGLRDVLEQRRQSFSLQYSCHAPDKKRWFCCRVTAFYFGDRRWLTVSHENVTRQYVAEERQLRYTELIESTPDFVGVAGIDRRIRFLNRAGRRLVGMEEHADVSRMTISDFHTERVQRVLEKDAFPTAIREGAWSGEAALLTSDGIEIPVWMVVVAHRNEEGEIEYLSTTSRDLTTMKDAERNNRMLASIVESSSDAIIGEDLDGVVTSWNQAAERIYQYTADEAIGGSIRKIVPPECEDDLTLIAESVRAGKQIASLETHRRRKDGQILDVSISVSPIYDDAGDVIGASVIARDITDRREIERRLRRREEELRQAEQRLRLVLDSTAEAIYGLDLNGRCTFANASCLKMLGLTSEAELLGSNMHEFFQCNLNAVPGSTKSEAPFVGRVCDGQPQHVDDAALRRRDGSSFPAEYWSYPVFEQSKLVGTVVTFLDISDRKRAEEQLREREEKLRHAQRMEAVGALAGGVAHEFNNLLQVISGYAQFAQDGLAPDDPRRADLEQALDAAGRAATLTSQLLSFSRSHVMCYEDVDLNELVERLASMLRPLLGERIALKTTLCSLPLFIESDASQLHQALMNLCVNARDAMPLGGELRIELDQAFGCEPDGDEDRCQYYAAITVTDTGVGMCDETRERIFEPFFTTKDVGEGTGLGLSMVYGVVSELDGTIEVASEVGVGTTFRICIPLSTTCEIAEEKHDEPSKPTRRTTILLAEDEPLVRSYLVRLLEQEGYEILSTADGAEAVRMFDKQHDKIDLLLLDVVMPELNGIEVVEYARRRRPDVAVVFCTGYAPNSHHVSSVLSEGMPVVRKPVAKDDLLNAIQAALQEQVASEEEIARC